MSEILPNMEELLARAEAKGKADGYTKALDDLCKALPDCDKVDIEHLVTIIEQLKENENE